MKNPSERKKTDLVELDKEFGPKEFFANLKKESSIETAYQCYRKMRFVKYDKGQRIFNYGLFFVFEYLGDMGTLFYIILKGSVGVKVPTKVKFDANMM